MSNILFLTDEFRAIGKEAQEAEQLTLLSPKAASVLIRSAMEKAVRWMYDHDYDLEYPHDREPSSLIQLPDELLSISSSPQIKSGSITPSITL